MEKLKSKKLALNYVRYNTRIYRCKYSDFRLIGKIKADFVGGAGADKVVRVLKDFNDPNDFNDFNAPDAIKKNRRKFCGGGNFAIFVSLKTFLSGRDVL